MLLVNPARKEKVENKEILDRATNPDLTVGSPYPLDTWISALDFKHFRILEGLVPYGGQTSSSCGGLVAFSHQLGALRAPIW